MDASEEAASASSSVKVFIGGLSWETSETTLAAHFSKFGALVEAVVMRDRVTKKPRGFGFVTFQNQESAVAACAESHSIDGRKIDAKPSVPQGESTKPRGKKIFVGGLAPDTSSEEVKTYFEGFGLVSDAQVVYDPNTKRSRGFGFVTFEDEETIQKVLEVGSMHKLGGKEVEVKNATPKGSAWEGDAPRGAYGAVQEGRGDGRGQGGFDQYDPYAAQGQYHGAYGYMPPAAYGYMGGAAYGGYHPAMMMRYGQYGGGYGGAAPPGPYGVPVYGAPTMGVVGYGGQPQAYAHMQQQQAPQPQQP